MSDQVPEFRIHDIHHVQLAAPAGCEAEARAFFSDCIGLCEIPKPPSLTGRGGVWFQVGEKQLHLGVQETFAPATKAHPAFLVNGLERLKSRLREKQIAIIEDAPIDGLCRIFVHDPFGNRLEFVELLSVP